MIAYRLLTGVDDASFCHKVTDALAKGWTLYGSPTYCFDTANQKMMCGQAVTKEVRNQEYDPDMKLGAL